MKRDIVFEIDCGNFTCASSPNSMCQYNVKYLPDDVKSRSFCLIFHYLGALNEEKGWVLRHDICIEQEGGGVVETPSKKEQLGVVVV